MSEVNDDSTKFLLSGLIAVASFLAARVFDKFDKGTQKSQDDAKSLQIKVAVLEARMDALEKQSEE